jgi:hypothetical protein
MRQLRVITCAAALAALIAPAASGQTWNVSKVTYLTFSGPVQVPGASLPAGTYLFRLADPVSHRQVIQIRDKEGTKIFTTLMSIPNQTAEPKDDPFVMFLETPAGQPAAVKAWFYPGEKTGYEFVYPKEQAMRIASYTKSPVLAHAGDVKSDSDVISDSKIGRVDAQGQFVEADQAVATSASNATSTNTSSAEPAASASSATTTADARPAPALTPSANRTESQVAVGTAGQRDTNTAGRTSAAATAGQRDAGTPPARQLPRTASDLGLVQLLSVVSLVGALALRQRRKYAAETRG